jgi:hypothetical protein
MHPPEWDARVHYGMCGQSCPCCRFLVEPTSLGVCTECASAPRGKKRPWAGTLGHAKRVRHSEL